MKLLDPIAQEDILDRTYLSALDIYKLLPLGRRESRNLFNMIRSQMIAEGVPLMPCRPSVVPLNRVLAVYPMNEVAIRRAAKRKRMSQ